MSNLIPYSYLACLTLISFILFESAKVIQEKQKGMSTKEIVEKYGHSGLVLGKTRVAEPAVAKNSWAKT